MQKSIIASISKRGGGLRQCRRAFSRFGIIPFRVYASGSLNYSWYYRCRGSYDIACTYSEAK